MTPEDVYAAIEALGSTANQIAESLLAKGIRGFRAAPCGCPMAVFVSGIVGGKRACEVTPGYFRLTPGLGEQHLLPRAAREFVIFFDAGRFSFLLPERCQ